MKRVIIIVGNAAVGKMTVGQELCKISEFRLCHNHMTIEPVLELFNRYDTRIIDRLRNVLYEEIMNEPSYNVIFTFMFNFDSQNQWEYYTNLIDKFKQDGAEVYFVELCADRKTRLQRNVSENRLLNKPSKNNLSKSNNRLIQDDRHGRYESKEGEIPFDNYIKIDNTNITAEDCARQIAGQFNLIDPQLLLFV